MKKILMILIILIMILFAVNTSEKNLDLPPEVMPEWWQDMTDLEQYEYFRQMAIEYVKANQIINEKKETTEESKKLLIDSNEFLKKYKPFIPSWGMDFNITITFDSMFTLDSIFTLNIKKIIFKGRSSVMYINPGFTIKALKNFRLNENGLGGGLNIGFGFLL